MTRFIQLILLVGALILGAGGCLVFGAPPVPTAPVVASSVPLDSEPTMVMTRVAWDDIHPTNEPATGFIVIVGTNRVSTSNTFAHIMVPLEEWFWGTVISTNQWNTNQTTRRGFVTWSNWVEVTATDLRLISSHRLDATTWLETGTNQLELRPDKPRQFFKAVGTPVITQHRKLVEVVR